MNKFAQRTVILKTAKAVRDPRVPLHVKKLAIDFVKSAGLFGSAMDDISSGIGDFTSGIGDLGSSVGSGVSSFLGSAGDAMSGLGSSIMSGIGSMLPSGVTWQQVADELKRSDPEIAQMSSNPHFMEALKQAISETGQPIEDVLKALGIT